METKKSSLSEKEKEEYNPLFDDKKEKYVKPPQYCLSKVGLEVYKTDEENYKPYSSTNPPTEEDSEAEEEETTPEETETETEMDEDSEEEFPLHMGEILQTQLYDELYSISFESDYSEMSQGGTVNLQVIDSTFIYKGVRVKLLSEWEEYGHKLSWGKLDEALLGFVTEQTFNQSGVEIKLEGMSKALDKKYEFDYKQMKRSEILEEIIKTAGLIPIIDVTGLDDDVTDFGGEKKSSSSSSSGSMSSTGSATIDEAVKKAISGKSDDLSKAKAIDQAFKSHVYYNYYYDVHHPDIDEAWKNGHLNCADGANVLCAMFKSAGLTAVIVHVPEHYIVKLSIGGKTYYTDNAASTGSHTSRPFGEVWRGVTSGSEVGAKISA